MAKAFLTGQQILDEYGRIDYDLIVGVAERAELQPIDPLRNTPITEEDDPCLFCEGGDWLTERPGLSGGNGPSRLCAKKQAESFYLIRRDEDQRYKCLEWQDEHLANRLRSAAFSYDNVVAYACKYWSASPDQQLTVEPVQIGHDEDPKFFAERMLASGVPQAKVSVDVYERYPGVSQWKAAGLARKKTIVGLDDFEKDKLAKAYQRDKKKIKQD